MADYLAGIQRCLEAVPVEQIAAAGERILDAYRRDKLVVIAGNGGSAATASHMACDLGKSILGHTYPVSANRFRVMALTDNVPLVTAWANDVNYEVVFAEQLKAWMRPGDLLVAISASGNSPNICNAIEAAKALGAFTIGFLGFDGGRAGRMVDLAVTVPIHHYGYAEDLHMVFSHMVTAYIQDAIAQDTRDGADRNKLHAAPKALILAAGEGTRLRPLTLDCPKPMLPIAGKPLLVHTVEWLRSYGVHDLAVNLHYLPHTVINRLGDGSSLDVCVTYSYEDPILGTAGAVRKLETFLQDGPFIVVYGDVLTDLDLAALLAFHREAVRRDPATGVTMSLYHVPNPTEVGLVELNSRGRITRFVEKPRPEEVFTDLANAGVIVVEPRVISSIPPDSFYDFGRHLFPQLLASGVSIYGWVMPESSYLLDIGSPEKYAQAQVDWTQRHQLASPQPIKAVR